jgi:hypothetical protein
LCKVIGHVQMAQLVILFALLIGTQIRAAIMLPRLRPGSRDYPASNYPARRSWD